MIFRCSWLCVVALLMLRFPSKAQNLFPDLGLEQTGVEGEAHSGKKAACPGGSLPAEPSPRTTPARR